ncbi:MAG: AAA family ATPase [Terrimonas sp.]|nr:AAA family ATPase [Terrimonas sp.]
MLKKIVIIGPESTGKSTLCRQLAEYFHTQWCPEYAREFLLKNGTKYSYDDLLVIAKGQLELEETITRQVNHSGLQNEENRPGLLFIDTDMYVMKVWCEFVFGKCHRWILEQIAKREYDYYLLCNTDLPWVKDELREYPDLITREKLFRIYKDLLINQQTPWQEIKGTDPERFQSAVDAINALMK